MPAGRPTKYGDEKLARAQEYVKHCQDNKEMPFIEELALLLEVHDDSIVEWAKEHDEFSATVKRLKMLQKLHLKKGALEKRLHPSLAVFLLKANHGMSEEEKEPKHSDSIRVFFEGMPAKDAEDARELTAMAREKLDKAIAAEAAFADSSQEKRIGS